MNFFGIIPISSILHRIDIYEKKTPYHIIIMGFSYSRSSSVTVPKLVNQKMGVSPVRKTPFLLFQAIIKAKSRPLDKLLPQKAIKRLTLRTDCSLL